MTVEDAHNQASAIANLLSSITALPEGQRSALLAAWRAVDQDLPAFAAPVQQQELELEKLTNWIGSLKRMPIQLQLEKLEDALQSEQEEWVRQILVDEIDAMQMKDPVTAIGSTLKRYAFEHPAVCLFGFFGLAVAVFHLARGAWRLVF